MTNKLIMDWAVSEKRAIIEDLRSDQKVMLALIDKTRDLEQRIKLTEFSNLLDSTLKSVRATKLRVTKDKYE